MTGLSRSFASSRLCPFRWLAMAIALAATIQALMAARSPLIAKDGIGFIGAARRLATSPVDTFRQEDQHPGYPAMILGASALTRFAGLDERDSWILAARSVSAAAGLGIVALTWLLSRRMFDERAANVAGFMVATLPLFRWDAGDALSDSPHLFFYLLGAFLALEAIERKSLFWYLAVGFVSGIAFLVRPEGLGIAVVTIAVVTAGRFPLRILSLLIQRPFDPISLGSWKTRLGRGLAVATATGAVVACYAIPAGKLTSKKNPIADDQVAVRQVAAAGGKTPGLLVEPTRGEFLPGETPRPSGNVAVFGAAIFELGKELGQGIRYFALIPLLCGCFAPGRAQPGVRSLALVLGFAACHATLLIYLYFHASYISHRHVMPIVALLAPVTSVGALWMYDRLAELLNHRRLPAKLAWGLPLFFVTWQAPPCWKRQHDVYLPIVEAAEWVAANGHPGDTVLSTSSYTRFYSKHDGLLLGIETPNLRTALAGASLEHPWTYLVLEIDERTFDASELDHGLTSYEPMLETPAHPKRPWDKIRVYRARPVQRVARRDP